MTAYTYILHCADDSYYVGSTTDLQARIIQHMAGEGTAYTRKRLPVTLVYIEEFSRVDDAFNREHQIKRWTRSKKKALIQQLPETLPRLARCQNLTHYAFQELRDDLKRYQEKNQREVPQDREREAP